MLYGIVQNGLLLVGKIYGVVYFGCTVCHGDSFRAYGSAIIVRTQKNLTSLGMVILLVLKLARHYLFGVVKESAKKAVRVSIARLRANVILVTSKWSSTLNSVRLTLPSVLPGARELEALFKVSIL